MKGQADKQTIDFIKTNNKEMELRLRLEQEQFFTQILWNIQDSELSKKDLKIFWFILIDAQKKQVEKLTSSELMKPVFCKTGVTLCLKFKLHVFHLFRSRFRCLGLTSHPQQVRSS